MVPEPRCKPSFGNSALFLEGPGLIVTSELYIAKGQPRRAFQDNAPRPQRFRGKVTLSGNNFTLKTKTPPDQGVAAPWPQTINPPHTGPDHGVEFLIEYIKQAV